MTTILSALPTPVFDRDGITLYNAPFQQVVAGIPDESVGMVLTDPPYFRDDLPLFSEMGALLPRVMEDRASLVTFTGHWCVKESMEGLESGGLRYWWLGGMTHTGLNRLPGKWVAVGWKPALWYVKGGRRKGDTSCPVDLFAGGGKDKRHHPWGQPVNWSLHWLEHLTAPGDTVLDPFVGGGTNLVAAALAGRSAVGCEIDAGRCDAAVRRLEVLAGVRPDDSRPGQEPLPGMDRPPPIGGW